jgi:hypothetical protein
MAQNVSLQFHLTIAGIHLPRGSPKFDHFKSRLREYWDEKVGDFGISMPESMGYNRTRNQTFIGYHGTLAENAEGILQDGFRKGRPESSLGSGVYTSPDFACAKAYAKISNLNSEYKIPNVVVFAIFVDTLDDLSISAISEKYFQEKSDYLSYTLESDLVISKFYWAEYFLKWKVIQIKIHDRFFNGEGIHGNSITIIRVEKAIEF